MRIELRKQPGKAISDPIRNLLTKINQLIEQTHWRRKGSIDEKLRNNWETVESQLVMVMSEISSRDSLETEENTNMLASRIERPLRIFSGFPQGGLVEMDFEDILSETSIKIPYMEKVPRYTAWVHLIRNQRMAPDQSVIGKRQIYYDQHGGETLICSDSDEDEPAEEEHKFTEAEDEILRMAYEELGLIEEVMSIVRLFVLGSESEIKERYENLKEKNMRSLEQHSEDSGGCESLTGICLEKSLNDALDFFDNLFCRQCIRVYDCPVHGCSQPLIYPSEKQPIWSEPEGEREPCSDQCYLLLKENSALGSSQDKKIKPMLEVEGILTPSSSKEPGNHQSTKANWQKERSRYVTVPLTTEICSHGDPNSDVPVSESMGKRKVINPSDSVLHDSTLPPAESLMPPDESLSSCKKLKKISDDVVTANGNHNKDLNLDACDEEKRTINSSSLTNLAEHTSNKLLVSGSSCRGEHDKGVEDGRKDLTKEIEFEQHSNSTEMQVDEMPSISDWKLLEKDLYLKGVEMFGRNSCLIARNLLSGMKTCMEVATYMCAGGESMAHKSIAGSIMDKIEKINTENTDQEVPSRSRLLRKRGKPRKFTSSRKSAGLPSTWRIAHGKNLGNKQYTPCGCRGMCGKQCPCLRNGTCCEKYCGCSKICKNRFRGCHCVKSQCRSRQCPCFAANRECDPDVCRNCWVSCGDGSLGQPARRGDGQCGNMMLLLRQKQRILWAKSDVAGWGAFSKNPVNKNDCLGEYTGELIGQKEAEKRGKLYDRANYSFLFNLNDQYVLDAYRIGDKLKFANHSSKPNCYAKVMLVAGDHRVGIFAKENIKAGEELFYDYFYGPDQSPPWIRKLKAEKAKKEESAASQSKAKKHQSH
ncbi:histone-lysine N-methyltransferase EZA1-like [Abrus precatorius]|uniref:Histone-lysine N-methyltransferase EZA1-like n=1 Tax=Abrus precatorius TaxID=3816 RepID=A0A8B8L434_ABRPR|nr:histone-lysine N-methyltransferase EZA1-like [Abrus precatorius]